MKIALLVLLLTTSLAHAEFNENLDTRWRIENSYGLRDGSFFVNNLDMAKLQGSVDLGVRRGRWKTYAEYSLTELAIEDDVLARGVVGPSSGLVHRFGTHVRYAYARHTFGQSSLEVFADLGVGLQHIRWDAGGHWTRPDLGIGVGSTMWNGGQKKHWGTTFGLRVLLSRRSDVPDNAPIACGGPCDMATRPTGIDRSFMADWSFHFGT